ncbi:MAG: hypothetical protein BGN92_09890 [Sphingobacteriales bacterium 41-5]|nr:MAG: hypothetical protein BGN92_09890 [Sphingobacteriales bacterium 41-5]
MNTTNLTVPIFIHSNILGLISIKLLLQINIQKLIWASLIVMLLCVDNQFKTIFTGIFNISRHFKYWFVNDFLAMYL